MPNFIEKRLNFIMNSRITSFSFAALLLLVIRIIVLIDIAKFGISLLLYHE